MIPAHVHHGYGFFPGGDPRRFSPDGEDSNSPEEIAAHAKACEEWNAREKAGEASEPVVGAVHGQLTDSDGNVKGGFIACGVSGFGMGSYEYDCDDPECDDAPRPLDEDWDAQVTS